VQSIEDKLLADTTIQGLIGADWKRVWGPVVFANDTRGLTVHADNTMVCYHSPTQKMLVVAIAGTNFNSPFGWLKEDFNVHTLVPWTEAGGTGDGNLSAGTAAGLKILLAMQDGTNRTMLTALTNYIAANQLTDHQIFVGGHSLGGALSPCVALYMFDNRQKLGLVNPAIKGILARPTAGPTPGDKTFNTTYEAAIGTDGFDYVSCYNTLDMVPLAWASADLATIPTLYDDNLPPAAGDSPPDAFMGVLASGLQLNALAATHTIFGKKIPYNPYGQIAKGRTALTGTFNTDLDTQIVKALSLNLIAAVLPTKLQKYGHSLSNLIRFVVQAGVQHTTEYHGLMNVPVYGTEYKEVLKDNPPPNTAKHVDGVGESVKHLSGVDIHKIDAAGLANAAG